MSINGQQLLEGILRFLFGVVQVIYWYLEALFRQIVPPPMKSIDGETILVTGASGGIGKEICKHLVRSGSNLKLILWDLNLTALEKLAEELKTIRPSSGLKVFPFAVDISTRENIETCCNEVKNKVGPVSIIVNNAGIAPTGNFLQLTNEQIEQTIQINLMSHFWTIRQFLPDMVKLNHGRIVSICSMGGLKAAPHAFPYFAAKFGVNGYMDALKSELELFNYSGIHCTTVYPYFVKTPLIRTLELGQGSKLPSNFQKFLEPSDVAAKTVEGMRREREFVYCPSTIPLITLMDYLLPMKLQKVLKSSHMTSFTHRDAEEHKRLSTIYNVPVQNGQSKKVE